MGLHVYFEDEGQQIVKEEKPQQLQLIRWDTQFDQLPLDFDDHVHVRCTRLLVDKIQIGNFGLCILGQYSDMGHFEHDYAQHHH